MTIRKLNLLLIDDDESYYLLVNQFLQDVKGFQFDISWNSSYAKAQEAIITSNYDIYLIDYILDEGSGLDLLRIVREQKGAAPVILLTAEGTLELDAEAMEAGATDYLVKGEFKSKGLLRAIRHALVLSETIETLRQARISLEAEVVERKKAEQNLRKAKEAAEDISRLKSEFLANVSHELRTPMHAILGFAEMGEKKYDSVTRDKLLGYFSRISESGQRLLHLLNDLLDLSKLEAGGALLDLQEHNLTATMRTAIEEFARLTQEKSLKIKLETTNSEMLAMFDHDKLMQVIRNLISNAIKFTANGKSIYITIKKAKLPITYQDNNGDMTTGLAVTILDEGVGIPEDELDTIFDKFVQSSRTRTGAGGTGLGLAICKEIISMHNGHIHAQNNPLGGATFTFSIPGQPAPKADPIS